MPQPSRKTRKTWRKNIDLSELEKNLELKREREVLLGDENEEFVIDETADSTVQTKKLKSTHILENKSKVKALKYERNNKPVNKKTLNRLMKIAGRIDNSTSMASIDKNGLLQNVKSRDLWDDSEDQEKQITREHFNNTQLRTRKPDTITREPLKLETYDTKIHTGKSYNPSLEAWKDLINKEFATESIKELNRQELLERQEMVKRMMKEEVEASDEEEEEEAEEDQSSDYKLSINEPTKWKKKTKTQRNKEKRHEKRLELEARLKELKSQIHELSKLEDLTQAAKPLSHDMEKKVKKTTKKLFKYNQTDAPLEVKLSDELNSNLKNVKAEGNLFYNSMINLQAKGLIETRIPVAKKKKYTPKITEKWTYKDFK